MSASAETDLYAALSGRAALTALVGTRIYPDAIPEGSLLPAIVYQRSSTTPTTTLLNVTVAEEVLFAISAWSETRTSCESVADEVVAALAASSNPYANRSTGYDPEVGLHAVTVECDWWHIP